MARRSSIQWSQRILAPSSQVSMASRPARAAPRPPTSVAGRSACTGMASPQHGGNLAPYLPTPEARPPRLPAVAPHEGEIWPLGLRTEARVGGGVMHGWNDRWLLCTEASRPSLAHHPHQRSPPLVGAHVSSWLFSPPDCIKTLTKSYAYISIIRWLAW